ncbi:MAG: hypothetical protein E7J78_20720 [Pantoea sp.]|nr:hypothetical protein [Pantoea sp.]
MNSTTSLHRGNTHSVGTVLKYMLSKLVSQHVKRIVAMSSLAAKCNRLGRLEREGIDRLNALLVLTIQGRQDALVAPSKLKDFVWGKTKLDEVLTPEVLSRPMSEEQAREISLRIVDLTPMWLRYGKPLMLEDIYKLVREICQENSRSHVACAA